MIIWWLVYISNIALKDLSRAQHDGTADTPSTSESRSTLILCAKGMESQGWSFSVAKIAFLAMWDQLDAENMQAVGMYTTRDEDMNMNQALITNVHR